MQKIFVLVCVIWDRYNHLHGIVQASFTQIDFYVKRSFQWTYNDGCEVNKITLKKKHVKNIVGGEPLYKIGSHPHNIFF